MAETEENGDPPREITVEERESLCRNERKKKIYIYIYVGIISIFPPVILR
jgi:hypothetical protein